LEIESIDSFKKLVLFISNTFKDFEFYFSEYWEYFSDEIIKEQKYVYADSKGLPDELVAPFILYVQAYFDTSTVPKTFCWDECWSVFDNDPKSLRFAAKTGRKEDKQHIFISQELDEFQDEHENSARAVIGNTYWKIVFNQPIINHKCVSDYVKSKTKGCITKKGEYSECVISSMNGDIVKKLRLNFDIFKFELTMSDGQEWEMQMAYLDKMSEYLDFKSAFNKWINFKYGTGDIS
jgi:hypothetical protein